MAKTENAVKRMTVLLMPFRISFLSPEPMALPIRTVVPIERPTMTNVSMWVTWLPIETADIAAAPLNCPVMNRSARP